MLNGTSCHTHDGVKLEILPTLKKFFLGTFPSVEEKYFMMMHITKFLNFPIIKETSFLDLIQSEIYPLKWAQKNLF